MKHNMLWFCIIVLQAVSFSLMGETGAEILHNNSSKSSLVRAAHGEESEGQGQETRAQQVPQSCEVRDGVVVWVQAPPPQPADHQGGRVEQNHHLGENNT